jgi:hypothetical protein
VPPTDDDGAGQHGFLNGPPRFVRGFRPICSRNWQVVGTGGGGRSPGPPSVDNGAPLPPPPVPLCRSPLPARSVCGRGGRDWWCCLGWLGALLRSGWVAGSVRGVVGQPVLASGAT